MNNFLFLIPTFYLIIYGVGAFFIVYHLVKYGITSWPKKIAAVFLLGSLFLGIINFTMFMQIDWQKIFDSNFFEHNININTTV